ncbi:hypothetical protein NFC81_02530 [Salinispirillum sp. LH 10-3-1]|uniref:Porin family protein n=1 Tax=Salinispirillum sp. LH 10-3-1 TaxID=2952525 RepID=A0AB38YH23_9GAMM
MKLKLGILGLLLYVLTSSSAFAERNWYWHYAPTTSASTQALGLSTMTDGQVGALQFRILAGYELESLGVNLQWQKQLSEQYPQWYLATGVTALQDFRPETNDDCLLFSCASQRSSLRTYSRWTWVKVMGDFRLDIGYGAELLWEFDDRDDLNPRLNPAFDIALGWALF